MNRFLETWSLPWIFVPRDILQRRPLFRRRRFIIPFERLYGSIRSTRLVNLKELHRSKWMVHITDADILLQGSLLSVMSREGALPAHDSGGLFGTIEIGCHGNGMSLHVKVRWLGSQLLNTKGFLANSSPYF